MLRETAAKAVSLELSAPAKLNENHDLDSFDCGEDSINEYLKKKATKAQIAKTATVLVVCIKDTNTVVGYYTLSSGDYHAGRRGTQKGAAQLSPTSTPITILGRMGVCKTLQGTGLSLDLIQDAVLRALTARKKSLRLRS